VPATILGTLGEQELDAVDEPAAGRKSGAGAEVPGVGLEDLQQATGQGSGATRDADRTLVGGDLTLAVQEPTRPARPGHEEGEVLDERDRQREQVVATGDVGELVGDDTLELVTVERGDQGRIEDDHRTPDADDRRSPAVRRRHEGHRRRDPERARDTTDDREHPRRGGDGMVERLAPLQGGAPRATRDEDGRHQRPCRHDDGHGQGRERSVAVTDGHEQCTGRARGQHDGGQCRVGEGREGGKTQRDRRSGGRSDTRTSGAQPHPGDRARDDDGDRDGEQGKQDDRYDRQSQQQPADHRAQRSVLRRRSTARPFCAAIRCRPAPGSIRRIPDMPRLKKSPRHAAL
jgi:hypothetical protein